MVYFKIHLHIHFHVEITDIDQVVYSEIGVFEQGMERHDEMQVFGDFWIKAFVPIGRCFVQTNEPLKGLFKEAIGVNGTMDAILVGLVSVGVGYGLP